MRSWPWLILLLLIASACSDEEVPLDEPVAVAPLSDDELASTQLFPFQYENKYGYMDRFGRVHLLPEFDGAGKFSEGLAAVKVGEHWGFIDKRGLYQVPSAYGYVSTFSEGKAVAGFGGRQGYINEKGAFVIDTIYDKAYPFSEGHAVVEIEGKAGMIDANGTWLLPPIYPMVMPFSESKALVLDTFGLFGYIDTYGQYTIPPAFEKAWPFKNGKAPVKLDGRWGYINHQGLFAFDMEAESCWPFADQSALVFKDGKWGFIDTAGNWKIAPAFEEAWEFSEGLAAVSVDSKWGFINEEGEIVISTIYDGYGTFHDGLAQVQSDSKTFWINRKGQTILPNWPVVAGEPGSELVSVLAEDQLPVFSAIDEPLAGDDVNVTPHNPGSPTDVVSPADHSFNVAQHGSFESLNCWERGKVPLARFIANYIADDWKGTPLIINLGKVGGKYSFVQANIMANGHIKAEFVILTKSGEQFRNDIIGPNINLSQQNTELIRRKLLNNLWYWDGEGVLEHRKLRKFKHRSAGEGESFGLEVDGGVMHLSFDGTNWVQH